MIRRYLGFVFGKSIYGFRVYNNNNNIIFVSTTVADLEHGTHQTRPIVFITARGAGAVWRGVEVRRN